MKKINSTKKVEDVDAIILHEEKRIHVDEEAKFREIYSRRAKVFTQRGIRSFCDLRIPFNSEYQDFHVLRAFTLTSKGTRIDVPEKAINIVSSPHYSPRCSGIRDSAVSFLGLDKGSEIEFEVEVADRRPWRSYIDGVEIMESEFPMKRKDLKIEIPPRMMVVSRFSDRVKERESIDGENRVYTWSITEIGGRTVEPNGFSLDKNGERVVYAVGKDSSVVLDDFREKTERRIKDELKVRSVLGLIEVLDSSAGPLEKISKIRKFVKEGMRQVGTNSGLIGYELRDVNEILQSRYGTKAEIALCVAALARRAGFKASVHPCGKGIIFEVPALSQFDEYIVQLNKDGFSLLVDSSGDICGLEKMTGAGLTAAWWNEKEYFRKIEPLRSEIKASLKLKIDDAENVEGQGSILFSGILNPFYTLSEGGDKTKEEMQGWLKKIFEEPEVKSSSFSSLSPAFSSSNVEFNVKNGIKKDGTRLFLTLMKNLIVSKGFEIPLDLNMRKSSLEFPYPFSESIEVTIVLGKGFSVNYLPKGINVDNEEFSIRLSSQAKDDEVKIERRLDVKSTSVSSEMYPEFRKSITTLLSDPYTLIVLEHLS
jgi:hypothetical protein